MNIKLVELIKNNKRDRYAYTCITLNGLNFARCKCLTLIAYSSGITAAIFPRSNIKIFNSA